MVYVISDIHGQYEKYIKMLDKIGFCDSDELYVLGDVVDRGAKPISVLRDMSMRANVFPILGNHELMAEYLLSKFDVEITEKNCENHLKVEDLKALNAWLYDGGQTTLAEYRALGRDEREYVLEYLSEFSPYEELEVCSNKFVLVHGGLPDFDEKKTIDEYNEMDIVSSRTDYEKRYFSDKYLVTGHTPTFHIAPEYDGKIFIGSGNIAIDCGAAFGKPLGCIRLDDFQEFYV